MAKGNILDGKLETCNVPTVMPPVTVISYRFVAVDEELINTLQNSKQAAKTIEKRVEEAAKTEQVINATR